MNFELFGNVTLKMHLITISNSLIDLSATGTLHYPIEHQKWSTSIVANLLLQKQTSGYV